MTLQELKDLLTGGDPTDVISTLKKGRLAPLPDIETLGKQWLPSEHKTITDKTFLPDRVVRNEDGSLKANPVNRIAFPFQKKIVNTAVSFTFGNPVKYNAEPENDNQEKLLQAILKIDHDAKLRSFNRKMLRELLSATEVAEVWYIIQQDKPHQLYGFPTTFKIRQSLFQPKRGDILYPFFDSTGDMIAFSREFKSSENKTFFETFTEDRHLQWVKDGREWTLIKNAKLEWGKIPVIYAQQEEADWHDVQIAIERLEILLSRFAETNDYHAAPKIFVRGKILSFSQKGDSGGIIEGELGSEANYLSWDHAPESVKLEIETLIRFIYGMTQTPDVSFDSVKGLAAISGEALKMLFMDAHLKVMEKKEILDEYLQRRVNLLLRMVATLGNIVAEGDAFNVEPEIVPFAINDTSTLISNLVTAAGGSPVISQYTAVQKLGWVDDIDAELKQIEEEQDRSSLGNVFG